MNPLFKRRVAVWLSTAIVLVSFNLQGCGKKFDIDSEADRKAMIQEIQNALTINDCGTAITLSNVLYQSEYSDNEIRMLYSTAHACLTGISFYGILDDITTLNFSTLDNIFMSLVQMFPSRSSLDSRLQSAWYAQDALQAILNQGAVVAPADAFFVGSVNPGSTRTYDRTIDANLFLLFVSMGELGAALNRYGYALSDDPIALGYHQSVLLPWITKALVESDETKAACGIASSLYNLIDAISASSNILPSSVGSNMSTISAALLAGIDAGAQLQCTVVDGYTPTQCSVGLARLRFRYACQEQGPAASAAAGVIQAINAGWL